jgi:predicted transcriptional regulator
MPKIEDFVLKKPIKKKRSGTGWDVSGLVQPTTKVSLPQRRPGRGEDSPASPTNEPHVMPEGQNNPGQTKDETSTKLASNLHQSSTKVASKWHQTYTKAASLGQESDTATSTTSDTKVAPNLHQSDTKVASKEPFSFYEIIGLQRTLLLNIYHFCIQRRSEETGPISLEHLSSNVGTTNRAAKIALQRLHKKGLLETAGFKNGRGGWTNYRLPKTTYQEVLKSESDTKVASNRHQTYTKVTTQLAPQLAPSPSSSSSSSLYNNKTTTTGGTEPAAAETPNTQTQVDPKWLALDISGLTEVGFTQTHLIQVARDAKLTPEIVQDSIRHFAFDLRINGKTKELRGPALNYFMGILRKGFPYAAPENYVSPEAEAMKTYLESKRADQERRKTLEDALYELEFTNWAQSLSEEEKMNLAPSSGFGGERGQQAKLSVHFRKIIWPALKNKSLQTVPTAAKVADSSTPLEVKKDQAV